MNLESWGIRMIALCQIYAVENKSADCSWRYAGRSLQIGRVRFLLFEKLSSVEQQSGRSRRLRLHIQPLHMVGVLLLRDDFARIELNEHSAIRFKFNYGYRKAKVVQE